VSAPSVMTKHATKSLNILLFIGRYRFDEVHKHLAQYKYFIPIGDADVNVHARNHKGCWETIFEEIIFIAPYLVTDNCYL
jgi:hypothetical protein